MNLDILECECIEFVAQLFPYRRDVAKLTVRLNKNNFDKILSNIKTRIGQVLYFHTETLMNIKLVNNIDVNIQKDNTLTDNQIIIGILKEL